MKKRTLVAVFFLVIATYIYPIGALATTTAVKKVVPTGKQTASKATVQNKKSVVQKSVSIKKAPTKTTQKTAKKKKKAKKHKDKIKTTIAPLIDPSNPPGGN